MNRHAITIYRSTAALILAALAALPAGCGGALGTPAAVELPATPSSGEIRAASARYVSGQVIASFRQGADPAAVARDVGARVLPRTLYKNARLLEVPGGNAERLAEELKSRPEVEFAEPNYIFRVTMTPSNAGYINQSKYLGQLKLPQAWNVTTGSPSVVTAVIDTGVDMTHPDLVRSIVPGCNVLTKCLTPPQDDNGHGTHVAGIIAGSLDSRGDGAAVGVAPTSKVMPIKALDAQGNGNTADIAAGILWAADNGARIINLSLGGGGNSKLLALAVQYAINNRRVPVLAAMGNGDESGGGQGKNLLRYPAAYPGVIAVGALQGDQRASFSDWGKWISVSAPGVMIYSTTPRGTVYLSNEIGVTLHPNHDYMDGTSMATPVVSGVVALMLSLHPGLTPALIKQRLETTATDVGTPGRDDETGYGMVNAFLAVGPDR